MVQIAQRTFAAGEITPGIYSRVDYVKYLSGLRACRNAYVRRHGGLDNRPGTQFIGVCRDIFQTNKLIPFVYDQDNAYLLEISWVFGGPAKMRFIKDGAYIFEAAKNISAITKASPGVVTSAAHGFSNDDRVRIQGVVGMTEINDQDFIVAGVTTNTFTLKRMSNVALNTTTFTTYVSGGTVKRVYSINFGVSDGSTVVADPFTYTYAQTGNTMVFAHRFGLQELVRTSDTSWAVSTITTFNPAIAAPSTSLAASGAGSASNWYVTTVKTGTYEESLVSAAIPGALPTSGSPNTISWANVTGHYKYNVYRDDGGGIGLVGSIQGTSFVDRGYPIDQSVKPPRNAIADDYFSLLNYPAAVCQSQQRRLFGGAPSFPETIVASQIGLLKNFVVREQTQDDDAFAVTLAGKTIQRIKHLVDIGKIVAFTDSNEVVINAGTDALTPTTIQTKTQSSNGVSSVPPLVVDNSALYIQGRGSAVRDLTFDFNTDGYHGNELSLFSSHLVDGFTITDWAYQQRPHSVIWMVRSDGVLLSLTLLKDQEIIGWARHDTDGEVESVAVIPDGVEDAVYITVKRTVNSIVYRYTEKLVSREVDVDAPEDLTFLDSFLTFDGRNTDESAIIEITGGTTWENDELLTLVASGFTFTAADVGQAYFIYDGNGDPVRFTVSAFTNSTHVKGFPHKTVPASIRTVTTSSWSRAVKTITNLWHLEGKAVSILADGFVVANPNNAAYGVLTVASGAVTLPRPYAVIHAGLPYLTDIETLNIDSAQSPMIGLDKITGKVTLLVEKTRGIFAGSEAPSDDDTDPLEGLTELKIREAETNDEPVALYSGDVEIVLRAEWNSNGRVFIRQVDPLPLTIQAAVADGQFPFAGGF